MHWSGPAAGLGVFAVALAAFAPATLVDARLEQASGGRLRLAQAQGSLWSGSGWIEVRDAHGKAGIAQRLAWRVLPASLLRARVEVEVELDRAARRFPVRLSFSGIEIERAGMRLPAAALGLGLPKLAPLRLSGEMLLEVAQLSFARGRVQGEATLRWRAAGSALTSVAPLGDYEVRLKASGAEVHAALSTLAGPLELEGKGSWSSGRAPSFLATARVPAQHREQLSPLFRLIAVERGAGAFELRLQ